MAPAQQTYGTFLPRDDQRKHPRLAACWGSRLLLSWVSPLLVLGQRRQLLVDDVWEVEKQQQSQIVSASFREHYSRLHSLVCAYFASFGWRYLATCVASLSAMLCSLMGPVALRHVVSALTSTSFSSSEAFAWVLGLFVSHILEALLDVYANFESEIIDFEFENCLKTLIFAKTLRLSAQSRVKTSIGDISNLYTSDSDAIMSAGYIVCKLAVLTLQVIITSYLLFSVLSFAALAGIATIIVMLVLNNFLSERLLDVQRVYRRSKDVRMRKVTEAFKAISIIKYNAWEDRFVNAINRTRALELRHLFICTLYTSTSIFFMWGLPVFISMSSFGMYALVLKHELTPATVFTSLALFQMIQSPLRTIPTLFSELQEPRLLSSVHRLF